jgi:hypothetical protein
MDDERAEPKETSLFVDGETKRKIGVIARAYERTMAGQVRWWASREYAELERLKLLPAEKSTETTLKSIEE